jgi:hypothetical protein
MIVFSIAFGARYVNRLFARCLPSLLAAPRPAPVSLLIVTEAAYADEVKARADALVADPIILALDIAGTNDTTVKSTLMLNHAVRHCLEADDVFAFAVPDLVYQRGTLASCHALHQLTGKTVAIFNGRVGEDLSDADLRGAAAAGGLADLFFAHMSPQWRRNTTTTTAAAGELPGHLAVDTPDLRGVFCAVPNPFLGRFAEEDCYRLTASFRAWDHDWRAALQNTGRLIAHTDLDAAMSVEPSAEKPMYGFLPHIAAQLETVPEAARRTYKFSEPAQLFTTRTRAAA